MKTFHYLLLTLVLVLGGVGYSLANTLTVNHWLDAAGNLLVSLGTCISGESACVGEAPDSYIMTRHVVTPSAETNVDLQIKATAGYVSHMICTGTDAAATAGTIILYDSLTETGTALYTFRVAALDYHTPQVFPIMARASTGLYLGFTTTADVYCTVFSGNS